MRRYLLLIIFSLVFLFALPFTGVASETVWQIEWQGNNMIEKITVFGLPAINADSQWEVTPNGERYSMQREVENWSNYQTLNDRLPIHILQKNFFVGQQIEIIIEPAAPQGLFEQLMETDEFNLIIKAPGFVTATSGEKIDDASYSWNRANFPRLTEATLLKVITVDGLLLGIIIIGIGLSVIYINFFRHMKKVDKIIAEEYSVKNNKAQDQPRKK